MLVLTTVQEAHELNIDSAATNERATTLLQSAPPASFAVQLNETCAHYAEILEQCSFFLEHQAATIGTSRALAVAPLIWNAMLLNTLHDSDNPEDQNEADHNPAVAYLLGQTYAHMCDLFSALEAYDRAYDLAQACLPLAMSKRQRMRVHYAVASACLRLGQHREALGALNSAIEQAAELPDPGAYAELAYLAAEASSRLGSTHAAAEYARISLGILRFLARDHLSIDAWLEVRVLVSLASSEFLLARYTAALEHLHQARQLTASMPDDIQALGDISRVESLLFRWRGQTQLALHHALAARAIYDQSSPSSEPAARQLSTIITSIALDLADEFATRGSSSGHATYVKLAHPYVLEAECHAQETKDAAAMRSALLVRARFDSVAGHDVNRVRVIEGVIGRADHDDDRSMLAQGYTTLGREYGIIGREEAALNCYRNALDAVDGSETPALGVFARRALLRGEEMQE